MKYKTEQEEFWAKDFGDEYCKRNTKIVKSNINLFSKILSRTSNLNNILEFGSNIGMNLQALNTINNNFKLSAIEINKNAVKQLKTLDYLENVFNESILEINLNQKYDLTFIKGVLIHINPEYLQIVYEKLYKSSNKYILMIEYYNPTPVEINYRGHSGKLFKRDFAGEIMDKYPEIKLLDYGFVYHRDNNFPQDDLTWFLLEK